MEFKVIRSGRQDKFETMVTDRLNEGWKIEGSVFITNTGASAICMTRETPMKMKAKK